MSFTVLGTGSAVPRRVVTNDDLAVFLDTNDEWIKTRTGIRERRICTDETISGLAFDAAAAALQSAGVRAEELDLILCATVCGDYITPSLGCVLQGLLHASCPAFDINAACPGFIFALDVAASYFARRRVRRVLVVAAECMSRLTDWNNRSTCVLFGDAAGAVVLGEGDDLLSIRLSTQSNPSMLRIPNVQGNCPYRPDTTEPSFIAMNGQEVFKFAVGAMCRDLTAVMEEAGLSSAQIDHVLPHQANMRIIESAQSRLDIPRDKYASNIAKYGNTSAASIPLLLDELNRDGRLQPGNIIAMTAFGSGLTSAACMLRWKL